MEMAVLIGADLQDAHRFRVPLAAAGHELRFSDVLTVDSSTARLEGLKLDRVYLTPRAVAQLDNPMKDVLVRLLAQTGAEGRGFYMVQESGEIYGPGDGRTEAVQG